jgi:hypothetical protein
LIRLKKCSVAGRIDLVVDKFTLVGLSLTTEGIMSNLWVVDTKCKVLPTSAIPQDGSLFYYGRSVVPADSEGAAVKLLTEALEENHILIETVISSVLYDDGHWKDDDEFEVHNSCEDARQTNEIELGCFVSEKSFQRS